MTKGGLSGCRYRSTCYLWGNCRAPSSLHSSPMLNTKVSSPLCATMAAALLLIVFLAIAHTLLLSPTASALPNSTTYVEFKGLNCAATMCAKEAEMVGKILGADVWCMFGPEFAADLPFSFEDALGLNFMLYKNLTATARPTGSLCPGSEASDSNPGPPSGCFPPSAGCSLSDPAFDLTRCSRVAKRLPPHDDRTSEAARTSRLPEQTFRQNSDHRHGGWWTSRTRARLFHSRLQVAGRIHISCRQPGWPHCPSDVCHARRC